MNKTTKWCIVIFAAVLASILWFELTPSGRWLGNKWFGEVQKVDDATNYKTLKQVEDTCRSMIASYESDKMTYFQFKDSQSSEQRSWADQAKMRANKTAASYNEYILKNSHVWSSGIPSDIRQSLAYID